MRVEPKRTDTRSNVQMRVKGASWSGRDAGNTREHCAANFTADSVIKIVPLTSRATSILRFSLAFYTSTSNQHRIRSWNTFVRNPSVKLLLHLRVRGVIASFQFLSWNRDVASLPRSNMAKKAHPRRLSFLTEDPFRSHARFLPVRQFKDWYLIARLSNFPQHRHWLLFENRLFYVYS